jgi:hypothetical protein
VGRASKWSSKRHGDEEFVAVLLPEQGLARRRVADEAGFTRQREQRLLVPDAPETQGVGSAAGAGTASYLLGAILDES